MVEDVKMPDVLEVLTHYKEVTRRKFRAFLGREPVVPPQVTIPQDVAEALRLGIQIGRSEGYGEGLVEGTMLGLDVSHEVVEAMMTQPVILSSTAGSA